MSIPTPRNRLRVLVTGATGLVGSHAAKAFADEGHDVVAFIRNRDKADRVFGRAPERIRYAIGDIGDRTSVKASLEGCDAVVHCAAMIAVGKTGDRRALIETNVGGVRNVIGSALDHGLERVVHVSSIAPLFRRDGVPVTETSEPQPSKLAYGQSKMLAETYVRELQTAGHPVKVIYPGAVIGPDDPGLTESMRSVQLFCKVLLPITTTGIQYIDVRDLAVALVKMTEDAPRSARYLAAGHFATWGELADMLETALGHRPPAYRLPAWMFRVGGAAFDVARKIVPIDFPLSSESAAYVTRWTPIRNSEELARLGVTFRPLQTSLGDTIAWMRARELL